MKHINKRGLGIAAAIAVAASVAAVPAAQAGGDDTRVEGRATFAGGHQIKIEDVTGDNNEGEGYFRFRSGPSTAYGRVLCVTGTKDGPGETAAIGLWLYKSNFPAASGYEKGEFVIQWVQQKSGPDASLTQQIGGNLQCPADGFTFATTVPPLVTATGGSYDVDVD